MDDLPPIPKIAAWLVLHMNRAGKIQLFDQFDTEQDALKRLEHLRSSGEDSQYQVVRQEWPIPDRTLPTDRQIRALWDFMHHVLVLIRSMSWDEKSQQIAELTDILEIMPLNIDSAERWDWNYFESALRKFAEKHGEGMRLARLLHEIHCNP